MRSNGWRPQRNAQGPRRGVCGFKRPNRCTGLRPHRARCWAPEGESRRGAHQRMSRRRRGTPAATGSAGAEASAATSRFFLRRRRATALEAPSKGWVILFPIFLGLPPPPSTGIRGGGGGQGGGGQSHSGPRANSLSGLASCVLQGGGCVHPCWLRSRPRHHRPPLLPWACPAAGAGGKHVGARAWWTFLRPSRPHSVQRRRRMGLRVT